MAEGLRVTLEPIPGVTKPGLLTLKGLRFQCPPMDEFGVTYTHSHTDFDTLDEQHSRAGTPQLATVEFTTLALDYATFVVDPDAGPPEAIRDDLRDLCLSGSPFLLRAEHPTNSQMITGKDWALGRPRPELMMAATLRSFKVTEKAGEGDARYFDVQFYEYRDMNVSRKAFGKRQKHSATRLPTHVFLYWDGQARDANGNKLADPPTHPLTLSWLARHFYKDPSLARDIARQNHISNWGMNDALILAPRFKGLKKGKRAQISIHSVPNLAVMGPQLVAVPTPGLLGVPS